MSDTEGTEYDGPLTPDMAMNCFTRQQGSQLSITCGQREIIVCLGIAEVKLEAGGLEHHARNVETVWCAHADGGRVNWRDDVVYIGLAKRGFGLSAALFGPQGQLVEQMSDVGQIRHLETPSR